MAFKKYILLAICIIMTISISGCNSSSSTIEDIPAGVQGNTNGNIHEGGYVVMKDDWMYYTEIGKGSHLVKKRLDGSDETELNDHFSYEINVVGNWIYYIRGYPGPIYRMTVNGEKSKKIDSKKCDNLIVSGRNVFYRAIEDNKSNLYKTDLNGRNKVKLRDEIIEFAIGNGNIYFSSHEEKSKLYKMDFNGKNVSKLSDYSAASINVDGERIIFTNRSENYKLYQIGTDGTNPKVISEDECWNVNLSGEHIYYRNQSMGGSIYRMKTDGSVNEKIIKGNCSNINVTDKFIVHWRFQGDTYFKTELDGSNSEEWK